MNPAHTYTFPESISHGWSSHWIETVPVGSAIRPDQFAGRGCPCPPRTCLWPSSQSQACEFPRHSTDKLAASRATFLRRRHVDTLCACILKIKYKWFTADLNYLCHCSSPPSIFGFVSLHFVFGTVLFTMFGFVEADQQEFDSLNIGAGNDCALVPSSVRGFSKLLHVLFPVARSLMGWAWRKWEALWWRLRGLSCGACLLDLCMPCKGHCTLPNLVDLFCETILIDPQTEKTNMATKAGHGEWIN